MARHTVRVEVWPGADVLVVALTQLPVAVVAPALQYSAVQDCAGEMCPCFYRYRGPPRAEVDRSEVVTHLVRTVSNSGRVPYPQLPVAVVAPALDAPVIQQGACVELPCSDVSGGPVRA